METYEFESCSSAVPLPFTKAVGAKVKSKLVYLAGNAEFYCSRGLPFVMGTTGGDRDKLVDDVVKSGVYSVIAPQMGKQVCVLLLLFQTPCNLNRES